MTSMLAISWPAFFAPSSAILFSLLVPLILFYFLKLKRPTMQIPSLVLWRQVLSDNRVNSPFQKFKRHILLLLQIILLVLLVLAAMQPYIRGGDSGVQRLPILIDCSASMAARGDAATLPEGAAVGTSAALRDGENNRSSRLEIAKQRVGAMIEAMLPDQEICLIAFSRNARRLTGFTNNKRELRDALAAITIEDVPSEVEDALRLAQAISRSEPFDKVMMISDGNFPPQANFDLSFTLDYQRLPAAGANLGITALNARKARPGEWNVFVTVEGGVGATGSAAVNLVRDGQAAGSERVTVNKRAQSLVFRMKVENPTALEVKLSPDDFDGLSADNVAYLELAPGRSLWVFAPRSMGAYRLALEAIPDIRLFPGDAGDDKPTEAEYDLVISDRAEDRSIGAGTAMYVDTTPDDLGGVVEQAKDGTSVVDWQRTNALLEHVELSDLVLLDHPRFTVGAGEGNLELLGYEAIAYGKDGPLMLQKRDGAKVAYYLLFHTDRSTMPYRIGFPIMLSNLVNLATNNAGLAETRAPRTGVLPAMAMPGAKGGDEFGVKGPDGARHAQKADERGQLSGVGAPRVGRYTIEGGGGGREIGASLLSPMETTLAGVDQIQFNELSVKAAAAPVKLDRNLWPLLVLIALGVLLVEWWFFHKKPAAAAGPSVLRGSTAGGVAR